MRLSVVEMRELIHRLLTQAHAPRAHAVLQADVLIEAELRGHPSHGVQRLPRLLTRIKRGLADPRAVGRSSWRAEAFLEVDGDRGLGPVVAMAALDALSLRAKETGIAVAAIANSNHLGMLAYYVERVAAKGQIGLALSTSEALVHPFGGRRAMLGTNPVAVAIPTGEAPPFVLDLATSIVSMGKIHDHALRGQAIPPDWALDAHGNPMTEAALARSGAIAPFGGAKGYGLGLAFELLVASLAGSALAPAVRGTLDADFVSNKGDVFIVVDPPANPGTAERLADYLDALRSSDPEADGVPVTVPGDRARASRIAALRRGIDVEPSIWAALNAFIPGTPEPAHSPRIH